MVGRLRERVDLDLGRVLLHKQLVQVQEGLGGLVDRDGAEADALGELDGLLLGKADLDIDGDLDNGVGVLLGNRLNVDTTLGGADDDGTGRLAVHQDGKVVLVAGVLALTDVHSIARLTGSTGLLRDQLVTEHLLGERLALLRTVEHEKEKKEKKRELRHHHHRAAYSRGYKSRVSWDHLRREGLDTTLETVVEGTLATATSQNLGLDHEIIRA